MQIAEQVYETLTDQPKSVNEIIDTIAPGQHFYRIWRLVNPELMRLRLAGRAVKLPHNFASCNSLYRRCDGHDHARRLQREACIAKLPSPNPYMTFNLLSMLDGLRES